MKRSDVKEALNVASNVLFWKSKVPYPNGYGKDSEITKRFDKEHEKFFKAWSTITDLMEKI